MSQNVTGKMQQAAQLLCSGMTTIKVAEELGTCRETISRWKQTPEFQQKMQRMTDELRDEMRIKLLRFSVNAVDMMASNLDEGYYDKNRFHKALSYLKAVKIEQLLSVNEAQSDAKTPK